jgi:competence ComEA-like helix-hairpin-helix protein
MDGPECGRSAAWWVKWSAGNSGNLSWGGSLLGKFAFLGMGVIFVWWVGWPQRSLSPDSLSPRSHVNVQSLTSTVAGYANQTEKTVPVDPLRGKEIVHPIHAVPGGEKGQPKEVPAFIVDLNDGTAAELEQLPGIGTALAGRIIAHRVSYGAFRHVEDVVRVPGIGEKRFQQLRPFIVVREHQLPR